jgi:hypothetical protein
MFKIRHPAQHVLHHRQQRFRNKENRARQSAST